MFLERFKKLQKQFPDLDQDIAIGWMEAAYKHEISYEPGVMTAYILDSAFAHMQDDKPKLEAYKEGKAEALEFMNTKLYKALNDK